MDITLPLDQMSVAEKLRALEAIWEDLSRNEANLESPAWHGQVLMEREERAKSGGDAPVDWDVAKSQLRKPGS